MNAQPELEQQLCERIEAVLVQYGIPADLNDFREQADRGDLTSDIAALFELWGSDCDTCGNACHGTMRCDNCHSVTHTFPLYSLKEGTTQ